MEDLLNISAVNMPNDIKALRRLHDTQYSEVTGERTLHTWYSYGILWMTANIGLSEQLRLIVSREMASNTWDLDGVMKILEREVDAREHAVASSAPCVPRKQQFRVPTATTSVAGNSGAASNSINCVYCNQNHPITSVQLWLMSVLERRS